MTVIFPCVRCIGPRTSPQKRGPLESTANCSKCNGRGWLESTEISDVEMQRWLRETSVEVSGDQKPR